MDYSVKENQNVLLYHNILRVKLHYARNIQKHLKNVKKSFKKQNETVFIPRGAVHRIENPFKEPVKIAEVQMGRILKETDIVRYKDIYGRIN